MKIKRNLTGTFNLRLTECEFQVLETLVRRGLAGGRVWDDLPSKGARRSWSQRISGGHFLRIDQDNTI